MKESKGVLLELVSESLKFSESFKELKGLRDNIDYIKNAEKQLSQLNNQSQEYRKTLTDLERAERQKQKAMSETAIDLQKLKLETAQLNKEKKETARALLGLITPYERFAKEVKEAKQEASNLGAQMLMLENRHKAGKITKQYYNEELRKLSDRYTTARLKAIGLDQQIKKLDNSVGNHQRNVGNYSSAIGKISGTLTSVMAGFGVVVGVDMFAGIVKSSYDTIKTLDAQNKALKEVFQTEEQVAFQKQYISDISNKYGLEILSTTEAYTKYAAAIKGTNLEGEKGREIFTAFSGATSKLGLSAEEQKGIFKALEQMISKGKIQAEELRGQLGDRMSGAFKLFADGLGISTAELDAQLKAGKVYSEDVLPKIAEQLQKQYDLASETDTLTSAQNRLTNAWNGFLNNISENKEIINALASGLEFLADYASLVASALTDDAYGESISIFSHLREIVNVVSGAFKELGIDTGKAIHPLDLVTTNIGFLKSALVSLRVAIEHIINGWQTVVSVFKLDFSGAKKNILDLVNAYKKGLSDIKTITNETNAKMAENRLPEDKRKAVQSNRQYKASLEKAQKEGKAYFQHNGYYFDTKTAKNTGKSLDNFIDIDGKLQEKIKKAPTPPAGDDEKAKKKAESEAKKRQKEAEKREKEAQKELKTALENEKKRIKYLEDGVNFEKLSYQMRNWAYQSFFAKKMELLEKEKQMELSNAKTKAEREKAELDYKQKKQDLEQKLRKDLYENSKKELEKNYKKNDNDHKNQLKTVDEDEVSLEMDKLSKKVEIYDNMIKETSEYYKKMIENAQIYGEDTTELEEEQNEKLIQLREERLKILKGGTKAIEEDIKYLSALAQESEKLTFEEQKQAILSDKKLSDNQKNYRLKLLEIESQIRLNNLQIKELETIKQKLEEKKKNGELTKAEETTLSETNVQIEEKKTANVELNRQAKDVVSEDLQAVLDEFSKGLETLGFENTANYLAEDFGKMLNKMKDGTADWADYTKGAVMLVSDVFNDFITKRKDKEIKALDEQLKKSQETTEQELGFIEGRLSQLNALQEMTTEQQEERNALEDEARTIKEQQAQREKEIEAQKARAEQRASAEQAIIGGLVGGAKALPNFAAAAASVAMGAIMAGLIMSKDPVPKYFVGRRGGKRELAYTQERGRELITDKHGNIKHLGHNKGATLTQLEEGDNVYTATETANILSKLSNIRIGENPAELMHKIELARYTPPVKMIDNSDAIAEKIGQRFEMVMKKYDKASVYEIDGIIYQERGGKIPQVVGKKKNRPIRVEVKTNNRD